MQQRTSLFIVAACALASLGFFLLSLGRFSFFSSESSSSSLSSDSDLSGFNSRRGLGVSNFIDPRSTDSKAINDPLAAEQEEHIMRLNELKLDAPTININNYRPPTTESQLVDVISIGCEYKLPYMLAQSQTWAAGVRHFWGFTEQQDFDRSCASMDEEMVMSYIEMCRDPGLGSKTFGRGQGHKPGWFCAQRRPGRALGWLLNEYQGGATPIPDILILVDDDTSVDIEKVKNIVPTDSDIPFIAAGSLFHMGKYDGFLATHGGFGTCFNKAAIQTLIQPIFCDERQNGSDLIRNACEKLRKNRAGESDLFQQGDSILDIFYKHASRPRYCMHSDWQMGYMIQNYLAVKIEQILPEGARHYCGKESVTCHNQNPPEMEQFVIAHPQIE